MTEETMYSVIMTKRMDGMRKRYNLLYLQMMEKILSRKNREKLISSGSLELVRRPRSKKRRIQKKSRGRLVNYQLKIVPTQREEADPAVAMLVEEIHACLCDSFGIPRHMM